MVRVCFLFAAVAAGVQTFRLCHVFPPQATSVDYFIWALGEFKDMQTDNYQFTRGSGGGPRVAGRLGTIPDYDPSIESVTPA